MAQAVERILGKDEVGGSSPPISSMIKSPFSVCSGGGDFYFALTRLAKTNPEYAALQNDYEAQQKILAMFNKALEGSRNNYISESSSTKYALKEYSQHQIDNWKNSKRIVVYESQNQLQQFIDDARAHKNLSQKMYFGIINDETANFIFQKTNIDVHNYNAVLRADSILKIFDSHGNEIKETQRGQRAISDKDILLLPELFGEIDYAEYQGKYQGMQGSNDFINVKSHLYPSITIGLVVQNKQLDIRVQTMYATKKGSNAAAANTVNNQSLPLTPETDNGNASSNNTVPQSDTVVNNSDMQEKRKFSLKEPAEETKDLIAVHNITTENMHKALDLGGFPMPSIAVMKVQQADANADYGEISVVFRKDTIDPESSSLNKVYGGDAWTPRFPRIDNEIDYDKALDIYNRAYELSETKAAFNNTVELHPDNIEDGINRRGLERYLDSLKNDYTVKQFYLLEHGEQPVELQRTESRTVVADEDARLYDYLLSNVPAYHPVSPAVWKEKYEPAFDKAYSDYYRNNHGFTAQEADNALKAMNSFQKKGILAAANRYSENGAETVTVEDDVPATKALIDSRIDKKAFEQWVDDTFAGIVKKQGIRNNAEPYTSSGDRRSFDALHYEVTLENIVKQMKSQRNGEETLFSGLGIWGVAAKNYGTIEELKADSTRLQNLTDEEYSAIKQGFGERLNEIAMALNTKYGSYNQYIEYDNKMTEILEALRYSKTKSGVLSRLNGYFTNATESTAEDLLNLVADIGNMAAQYFEAKPQRAVGFDEIAYVVIPDNADDGLKSALTGNGIEYREYEAGNEQSRVDVLNSLDDVKFSRKESADYSYDALVSKPDMAVTIINDQKNYTPGKTTRENVVSEAQKSALSIGRKDSAGNVYVYVNDTGTEVMLSKRGLRHSLDRRLSIIAPVTENIGPIIKNSIRINELSPELETIKNSYVLIGIAKNQKNEPYVVSFVVNRASNEVMSVDVLYAVNAKKEATALIEPELSSQSDVSLTASTISISDLLDYVNRYYPDILPEDVLKHYGYTARPSGVIGENALYSLKEEDNPSIFEDNDELNDAAESLQEMLRYVSAENNELRSAFDIKTDSLYKKTVSKVGRNEQVRPTTRRGCYQQPVFSSACHASRFACSNLSKYKKAAP